MNHLKKLLLLGLLLTNVRCSTNPSEQSLVQKQPVGAYALYTIDEQTGPMVDTSLIKFVDEFLYESQRRSIKLNRFHNITYISRRKVGTGVHFGRLGMCDPNNMQVFVESSLVSDSVIRIVLFHELGHCVLKYKHSDPIKHGVGIMNPKLKVDSIALYYEQWEQRMDQYFSSSKFGVLRGDICPDEES